MSNLTVTLVEIDQVWENKQANFDLYIDYLKGVETDLILLPEMFNTAFSMNAEELAEPWGKSVSIQWLQKLSKEKSAAIYTSLIIKENENYYNRGVFVCPNGRVKYYDKRKSFSLAGEDKTFTKGEKEVIVDYKGWKFQLQICYDLRFPEIVRNRIKKDGTPAYDAILYVANWPEKRIEHWSILLKARAIENQCYVLSVNRLGVDCQGLNYNGCSSVVSANGIFLSPRTPSQHYNILKEDLHQTRTKLPFLIDCNV
ncbi:MAG TPA: nitrilase family protein [Crocinitomicaceae bacterium]|nr:nitrilase family protein [Crocinitomicaceae bacterium]